LDICPRVVQQGHKLGLVLVCWWNSIQIFTAIVLVYLPSNTVFPFSPHIWPSFVVCLKYCHSDWGKIISQCSCDVHSFIANNVEFFFAYLSAICISSSKKHLFNSFSHWLVGMLGFWVFNLSSSLYILGVSHLSTE
jgi:hypothetical protein